MTIGRDIDTSSLSVFFSFSQAHTTQRYLVKLPEIPRVSTALIPDNQASARIAVRCSTGDTCHMYIHKNQTRHVHFEGKAALKTPRGPSGRVLSRLRGPCCTSPARRTCILVQQQFDHSTHAVRSLKLVHTRNQQSWKRPVRCLSTTNACRLCSRLRDTNLAIPRLNPTVAGVSSSRLFFVQIPAPSRIV